MNSIQSNQGVHVHSRNVEMEVPVEDVVSTAAALFSQSLSVFKAVNSDNYRVSSILAVARWINNETDSNVSFEVMCEIIGVDSTIILQGILEQINSQIDKLEDKPKSKVLEAYYIAHEKVTNALV